MDQLANFVAHSPSSPQGQQIPAGQESSEIDPTSRLRLVAALTLILERGSWAGPLPGVIQKGA